jgi:hypothetical protein
MPDFWQKTFIGLKRQETSPHFGNSNFTLLENIFPCKREEFFHAMWGKIGISGEEASRRAKVFCQKAGIQTWVHFVACTSKYYHSGNEVAKKLPNLYLKNNSTALRKLPKKC